MYVKGLLEMMFEVQSEWIDTFIDDMDSLAAAEALNAPAPPVNGSNTPPSSANTSPRGSTQSQTPSGRSCQSVVLDVQYYERMKHALLS